MKHFATTIGIAEVIKLINNLAWYTLSYYSNKALTTSQLTLDSLSAQQTIFLLYIIPIAKGRRIIYNEFRIQSKNIIIIFDCILKFYLLKDSFRRFSLLSFENPALSFTS